MNSVTPREMFIACTSGPALVCAWLLERALIVSTPVWVATMVLTSVILIAAAYQFVAAEAAAAEADA